MANPQRGEIWRVKWGGRKGTELGAGKRYDERPCLVISSDYFYIGKEGNKISDGLTVVPLTSYKLRKEEKRPLWTITFTNRYDVDIDPWNDRYPENEQLHEWLIDDEGQNYRPYKSIVDCSQIWTINTTSLKDPLNDLRWDRRHGKLKAESMFSIDAALQIVLGGGVRAKDEKNLPVRDGQVLSLKLPERNHLSPQRCLVISSSGVDAIREHLVVEMDDGTKKGPLGHCTVVPLENAEDFSLEEGVAIVDVYQQAAQEERTTELALCMEIYTVDWRARDGVVVGYVHDRDMHEVRKAVRDYLALPR